MAQTINISKAKQKLLELARRNEKAGESFIIIKDGEPVSALIPFDEYESILETLDILKKEPDILGKLKKAHTDIKSGKYITWNQLSKKDKAA